jgi:hypothetical protein
VHFNLVSEVGGGGSTHRKHAIDFKRAFKWQVSFHYENALINLFIREIKCRPGARPDPCPAEHNATT